MQVLPLVPPDEGGSPYSGKDANCGNTLLISLEELVKDGLLSKDELPEPINAECVNFSIVSKLKDSLITKAAWRLILSEGELRSELHDFRGDPNISSWLEDAAYFAAINNSLNTFSWYHWPEPLKNRHLAALEGIYDSQKDFIELFIAKQFLLQRQWQKVRKYAHLKGVSIMGDMPIYVDYHSADVWANKKQFLLNKKGFPLLVSGVPPDLFSKTGQLWGSPLYDWKAMEKDGFSWWVRRIQRAQDLYDEFRIDHFRGFTGFWAVPSEAKVAMVGRWKVGPGKALFDAISRAVGKIKIIAEDLGVITEDVVQLRKSIGAPGMAVLQFGFGSDADNPHLPHNHERNQVVYTGTHDNDTICGWWENMDQEEKFNVLKYFSISDDDEISWKLIRAVLSSVAQTTVIPMQDILGLGSSARMNTPATQVGNWSWRIPHSMTFDLMETEALRLRDMLSVYGRL
ncbi:4-alpha-glucanotransferase DPE1, chloroplastic/amyloplastic [Carica papaya]|uniref:4-alpha-glucanotransferase DPE1, chloroplastic/amyloplastic n=1 Tax=Carica papaya TaxID=3649 RepID=UPI000B8C7FD8|nr:4-alpha-glucanotransferase DPE1, chloroplastic/amyloplastic [Carica papaya]